MRRLLVLLLLLAGPASAEDLWKGRTAAFFGLTFIDTSTEGELNGARPDETARIERAEQQAADAFAAHGIELLDLAPVAGDLARIRNPASCGGCELRMARALGADYAVVGEVQKVSNLILAMNLYVKEVSTGRQIRGQAVDIRGNTDESWQCGMRYILERNIFR
ncbi:DUF3280 domain-containing protein [Cereibacter johrii]|uniref:DUF3280 domain-containing protein n=1 Tax=Cereibacter johrii TaxID=445629 RepID=UPI000DCD3802|nr:DUF3280 domain-containing protein [Cereibacter johrii]RAZ88035.1 hypothetical protein DDV93_02395 [Cereibacter johrii]